MCERFASLSKKFQFLKFLWFLKSDINRELDDARAKFEAGLNKAHKTLKYAESVVHLRWTNKMGKWRGGS